MKLASRSLAIAVSLFLAAGCDDEDVNMPDGGASTDGGRTEGGAPTPDAATVTLTPKQARGQYLVDNVIACADCHTPRDMMGRPVPGKYMSGAACFIKLPSGDCLHTPNLTNDPTGLKNRSDAEIKDMFLNGKRPAATSGGTGDGGAEATALHPVMPYYVFKNMDADDADAIVAYLRTIPAVEHSPGKRGALFDIPAPAPPIDPNTIPLPIPGYPSMESALRGRYLTSKVGLCLECHTQHNPMGMPTVLMAGKFFQGGERFDFGFPVVPVSKNLTSDMATGLGSWKVEDIVKVLKEGKDKDGKGICPPMPVGPMGAYGGLTYQDALDIANYIKSLPAASNMVVDMCTFPFGPPPAGDGGAPSGDGGAAPDAATSTDGAATADAPAGG